MTPRRDAAPITTGLVDTNSTPTLLRMIATGQLDVGRFSPGGAMWVNLAFRGRRTAVHVCCIRST